MKSWGKICCSLAVLATQVSYIPANAQTFGDSLSAPSYAVPQKKPSRSGFNASRKPAFGNVLVDAADRGNMLIVKGLINKGTDVNSQGKFNTTALMRAAYQGNQNIGKVLLDADADVNATDIGGATALHIASRQGKTDFARQLLEYNAKVDARDSEGWTPLMRAVSKNHKETARTLVDKGADVNSVNFIGETALMHAVRRKNRDIAVFLLENGADASKVNSSGKSTLNLAKNNRILFDILTASISTSSIATKKPASGGGKGKVIAAKGGVSNSSKVISASYVHEYHDGNGFSTSYEKSHEDLTAEDSLQMAAIAELKEAQRQKLRNEVKRIKQEARKEARTAKTAADKKAEEEVERYVKEERKQFKQEVEKERAEILKRLREGVEDTESLGDISPSADSNPVTRSQHELMQVKERARRRIRAAEEEVQEIEVERQRAIELERRAEEAARIAEDNVRRINEEADNLLGTGSSTYSAAAEQERTERIHSAEAEIEAAKTALSDAQARAEVARFALERKKQEIAAAGRSSAPNVTSDTTGGRRRPVQNPGGEVVKQNPKPAGELGEPSRTWWKGKADIEVPPEMLEAVREAEDEVLRAQIRLDQAKQYLVSAQQYVPAGTASGTSLEERLLEAKSLAARKRAEAEAAAAEVATLEKRKDEQYEAVRKVEQAKIDAAHARELAAKKQREAEMARELAAKIRRIEESKIAGAEKKSEAELAKIEAERAQKAAERAMEAARTKARKAREEADRIAAEKIKTAEANMQRELERIAREEAAAEKEALELIRRAAAKKRETARRAAERRAQARSDTDANIASARKQRDTALREADSAGGEEERARRAMIAAQEKARVAEDDLRSALAAIRDAENASANLGLSSTSTTSSVSSSTVSTYIEPIESPHSFEDGEIITQYDDEVVIPDNLPDNIPVPSIKPRTAETSLTSDTPLEEVDISEDFLRQTEISEYDDEPGSELDVLDDLDILTGDVEVAEAVRVADASTNISTAEIIPDTNTSTAPAVDEDYWLRVGEFENKEKAEKYFKDTSAKNSVNLAHKLISHAPDSGNYSIQIGPLPSVSEVYEYCVIFQKDPLRCSTVRE